MFQRQRVPTEERELLPINHSYGHGRKPSADPETTRNGAGGGAHAVSSTSNNRTAPAPRPLSPPPRRTATLSAVAPTTIHVPPAHRRREVPSVHDAALADLSIRLYGSGRGRVKGNSTDATTSPPAAYTGPFPRDFDEPMFDPFSGLQIGVMKGAVEIVGGDLSEPHSPTESSSSSSASSSSSSDAHSDTWAALAKIRTIQSEVARTHLKSLVHDQENRVDGRSSGGRRGSVGSTSRERASGVKAPDRPDAFAGRREAIDEIVRKLEDLSSAVKHLHNLPAPSFTFLDAHSCGNTTNSSSPQDEAERPIFGRSTLPNRAHSSPIVPGSPASSTSTTYPHTSSFSSPLLSMSTSPRYVNNASFSPPSARPPRINTAQASTFTFPARSPAASAVGSKGHLPPIWDSPEDLVKSPRRQQTFGASSGGGDGQRGATKRSSAPRSAV